MLTVLVGSLCIKPAFTLKRMLKLHKIRAPSSEDSRIPKQITVLMLWSFYKVKMLDRFMFLFVGFKSCLSSKLCRPAEPSDKNL